MLLELSLKKDLCVSNTQLKGDKMRNMPLRVGEHETEVDLVVVGKNILYEIQW